MIDLVSKVIFLGDVSVGKTSIFERYFKNTFHDDIPATIGTSFQSKIFKNDAKNINLKMNVWDTCGQERFRAIASIYYKDASAILIVLDAFQEKSLEVAKIYLRQIKETCTEEILIFLVINKVDLLKVKGDILTCYEDGLSYKEEFRRFIDENDFNEIFWTSCLEENSHLVFSMFENISNHIMKECRSQRSTSYKKLVHNEKEPNEENNNPNCCI